MPSKKFHSGSPLGSIRDSRWLNFINEGAEIAQRIAYDGSDKSTEEPRTSAEVRNDSGGALERFSIVGITGALVAPDANEDEFLNHFALTADTPDTDRDGPGRIAVLQTPLADEDIGPALLWGLTPVKIDLPDAATYTAASLINSDATKLDADNAGDIVVVWHEEGPGEKWAVVHLGAGGSGGTDSTTLTDGCECNSELLREAGPLIVTPDDDPPTVCCQTHKRWTVDLGPVIGLKNLYWVGEGDVWSTYNEGFGLDNPVTIDCYPDGEDEYDVVMTLTATSATITLEPRAALNCDPVCFEYHRELMFACKKANQFNLIKFSGALGLDLPACVCAKPGVVGDPPLIEACDLCGTGPLLLPYASIYAVISGTGACPHEGGYTGVRSDTFCLWGQQDIVTRVDGIVLSTGVDWRVTIAESGGSVTVAVSWFRYYDDSPTATPNVSSSPVEIPDFCALLAAGQTEFEVDIDVAGGACSGVITVYFSVTDPNPPPNDSGHCTGCGEPEE